MTDKHHAEDPITFKASNYRGIEYLRNNDSTFYMKTCGIQRCLPGYVYPHNSREGYHLHAVLSGKGILRVNGRTEHIHEGQLFLLKEGDDITYRADPMDPWHYVWITYGGEHARRYMNYAGFTEGVSVLDCNVDPMAFFNIVKEILDRPYLNFSGEFYRSSLAIRFFSLAIESWEKGTEAGCQMNGLTVDDYVSYAAKFMQSNYAAIKVSDVADYIGINRSYLTTIFKKKMLMSPQEYLMQVRMGKSKELLQHTNVPIRVVAREVGYEDQLAFSKMFRKKYGLSPEQYRKKHQKEATE